MNWMRPICHLQKSYSDESKVVEKTRIAEARLVAEGTKRQKTAKTWQTCRQLGPNQVLFHQSLKACMGRTKRNTREDTMAR